MIDLTPLDIRKKKADFTRALRGYEPREVDHFLDTVAERLEEVVKVNLTLRERVGRLAEQVQGREGRERAVQEALVSAQTLKHDIEARARRDAEQIRREAEQIKRDAESESEDVRQEAGSAAENMLREAELAAESVRLEAESAAENVRLETELAVESARDSIQGMLDERRRELVELSRARDLFLKNFRGLLERELDALEVAESNPGSDELDLDVLQFGRNAVRTDSDEPASLEAAAEISEVTIELTHEEELEEGHVEEDGEAAALASAEALAEAADPRGLDGESEVDLGEATIEAEQKEAEAQPAEDDRSGRAVRERVSAGDAGDAGSGGEEERWGVR
jgi:DivIVA domain-containing protein